MTDSLESWNDFRRGETVTGKRTRKIVCSNCDKLSNPEHDGKYAISEGGKDLPVHVCDECDKAMSSEDD